jgi:hypothetical protein
VKLTAAIEIYVAEMKRAGQMRSRNTELAYRQKLHRFADEIGNRDPRTVSRDEIRAASATGRTRTASARRTRSSRASSTSRSRRGGARTTRPARSAAPGRAPRASTT